MSLGRSLEASQAHSTFCAWHSRPPQRGSVRLHCLSKAETSNLRQMRSVSLARLQGSARSHLRQGKQGIYGVPRHHNRW